MQQEQLAAPHPQGTSFVLIQGLTVDGKKFRPSDWCERLHSTLRALDPDEYEECVEHVHLVNSESGRGILVDRALETINPMLFKFFMNFVKNNHLSSISYSKENWESQKNDE
ncbi:MAG: DUF3579 domain-containing protein [Gammaproteobacteria bacterium]